MNTKESNKLIAEFMGMELYAPNDYDVHGCRAMMGVELEGDKHFYRAEEMLFHKDWNWLMALVLEIRNHKDFVISNRISANEKNFPKQSAKQMLEGVLTQNKDTVYEGAVEFIKWYNENK